MATCTPCSWDVHWVQSCAQTVALAVEEGAEHVGVGMSKMIKNG